MSALAAGRSTAFADSAAAFGAIHAGSDTRPFVRNLQATIEVLDAGGYRLPVTVNDGARGNAWVCSPYTTYCDYAREELQRKTSGLLRTAMTSLLRPYGWMLERAAIDRAVTLNNWLLSTNLYPALDRQALVQCIGEARRRWPQHALWFRSLNVSDNRDWIAALAALGFRLVATRQVYLFDDLPAQVARHGSLKRDLRLLRTTPLARTDGDDFTPADYARIETLYARLYLEKYSTLNPQYTARFMQRWHAAGLLRFAGFRDDAGVLQGVVGMFAQDGIVSTPIVGYDTALPRELGLYRLLMASLFDTALAGGMRINLSAGAAEFKRRRGGEPAIEYSAVLAAHLAPATRRTLAALGAVTTRIGVPVMRRFGL